MKIGFFLFKGQMNNQTKKYDEHSKVDSNPLLMKIRYSMSIALSIFF